jgi:microcystin-dependent protein
MSEPYLGQIMAVAFGAPIPKNWLPCDGRILQISTNTGLYTLLENRFGGDGKTTFALPDLRGRVFVGAGTAKSGMNYVTGQTGGAESVALAAANTPSHTHQVVASTTVGTVPAVNNIFSAVGPISTGPTHPLYAPVTTPVPLANPVSTAGGGTPHENMQPFLVLNYIISMGGIYPPRQ